MNILRGLSFQQKLLILLGISLLMLTIGLTTAVWYSFNQAENQIELEGYNILSRQTETFLTQQAQERARNLELQFSQLKSIAIYGSEVLKKQNKKSNAYKKNVEYILKSLLNSIENTKARIYFYSSETGLTYYPPSGFPNKTSERILTLPKYLPNISGVSKSQEMVIWSQPHPSFFEDDREWMIDVFVPFSKNNPFDSYIGISISLTDLITQFNQLHPTRGSYSFLMDERQNLVAALPHARLELAPYQTQIKNGLISLKENDDQSLDTFFKEMSLGRNALAKLKIKGEEKYIATYSLKTLNWRLGIVVPVSNATAASFQLRKIVGIGMNSALKRMIIGAVLVFAFSILIGGLLIRQLLIPLHMVTGVSHSLAEGGFQQRVEITSKDEIGLLAKTFNRMADQIQILVSHLEQRANELESLNQSLEQKVLERTAKLEESSLALSKTNKQLQQEIKDKKEAEKALIIANEKLQQLATIDGLTQIANRRKFDEKLQMEWTRLAREKKPLSLILFDVDYFKLFNDHYGHQAGDLCLKRVALIASQSVQRPADLVARYGGEEFAIVLPNTKPNSAIQIVKNIQKLLYTEKIYNNGSEVNKLLTISFGITGGIPKNEMSPDNLILQADKALYLAKQKGRNQYQTLPMPKIKS